MFCIKQKLGFYANTLDLAGFKNFNLPLNCPFKINGSSKGGGLPGDVIRKQT